jgi:hypothetical protein
MGSYNVSPNATPDGKGFVFVRRDGGRFLIAIQDYATRQVQVLTSGPLDESPSIAPNSKLIIYAAQQGPRGILAGVSSDGRIKQRLVSPAADVREPAWGPAAAVTLSNRRQIHAQVDHRSIDFCRHCRLLEHRRENRRKTRERPRRRRRRRAARRPAGRRPPA